MPCLSDIDLDIDLDTLKYLSPINSQDYLINNISEIECSICIGTLDSTKWCKISCNHVFHIECMQKWLANKLCYTCPNCVSKLKIVPNITKRYYNLSVEEQIIYNKTTEIINNLNEENKTIMINLANFSNCKIDVTEFEKLDLSLEVIYWYLEIQTINILYQEEKMKYKSYFNIYKKNIPEIIIDYNINDTIINITLAQANFFCWFFEQNILDQIINTYKLFITPESFYIVIDIDLNKFTSY